MDKSCVIGHPITHSRSPLIHRYWLRQLGIAGEYDKCDVAPEDLESFFENLRQGSYLGCNVTLPHKEKAIAYMDDVDDIVRRTGSLNTVYRRKNRLCATSTDGEGFLANVLWRMPGLEISNSTAMLLGAGGSARAIVDQLLRSGIMQVFVANRTASRAEEFVALDRERIKSVPWQAIGDVLPRVQLLINATSAGIANDGQLHIEFAHLPGEAVVTDINYVPLTTAFLIAARQANLRIVPGLGMLLHQAVRGFELWFGHRPTVTAELYDLVARDIDPDYRA
jgi:shikimate dehydrogenase